jgi:heptosyltransferase II
VQERGITGVATVLPSPLHLETVLVIGPNWVGDAVMSTPVLANLRQGLPKARLDLLVPRYVAPLFEEHPHVDRLLRRDPEQPWWQHLALLWEWRRQRYDAALLLPNSLRAALHAWLVGPPIRVGYATEGRGFLLTHAVSRAGGEALHQIDAYLRLLTPLHVPIVARTPTLVPSTTAEMQADQLWAAHGLQRHEPVIGMCPGAAFGPAKRWWPERFAGLADRLIAQLGVRIILFGAADEVPLVEHIRSLMAQPAISFAGKDTLSSFIALAARCMALVTNDSGSMHMASAVGTPVVAVFGPTDARRTAPATPRATVLRRDLACSPCFRPHCPYADHPCMRLVDVDEAYKAVLGMLEVGR